MIPKEKQDFYLYCPRFCQDGVWEQHLALWSWLYLTSNLPMYWAGQAMLWERQTGTFSLVPISGKNPSPSPWYLFPSPQCSEACSLPSYSILPCLPLLLSPADPEVSCSCPTSARLSQGQWWQWANEQVPPLFLVHLSVPRQLKSMYRDGEQ